MNSLDFYNEAIKKYDVDKTGCVWNLRNKKFLKLNTTPSGYRSISVYMGKLNGKPRQRNLLVHRFVAYKYIPNPENYPQINHKDGNRQNNNVENLEWCDAQWNVRDGFKRGRIIWSKGRISKRRIFYYCKKFPRQLYWLLTKNDFKFAKIFFEDKWQQELKKLIFIQNPVEYLFNKLDRSKRDDK